MQQIELTPHSTQRSAHATRLASAGSRTVYLQTDPDPIFATVHVPAALAEGTTGIVLCPPLGWDEECTFRARRAWAAALAHEGHPAIRPDLPGTGDSAGSASPADRLQDWVSAVTAAAAWLRDEFGCARICALGLGFGGMLAWLAAAQGAPIDDLILWGAPARGRKLVRELQLAANLDIDFQLWPGESPAPPELADGDLLHEAGQVLSKGTIDSISAVDLRRITLPNADRRRAIFFQRTGVKADRELAQHLEEMGAEVTVHDGDSYDTLMRYVQQSEVPRDAIARSIAWLRAPGAEAMPADAAVEPPRAQAILETSHAGAAIRETPVTLALPSGSVFALITEPAGATRVDLSVVMFSGGSDRRIGPNRMWVEAARRWAARGVTSVRLDVPGTGDADGDERALDALQAHYDPAQVQRAIEVLDALQARGLPRRFVLAGFCSGGYRSLQVARADARVVGVVALALPFFRWTWWAVNIRDSWVAVREPRPSDTRLKLLVIRALQRCLRVLLITHHAAVVISQPFQNRGERLLRQLAARDVEVALVPKRSSYTFEQLTVRRRRASLRTLGRLQFKPLPGEDRRMRPIASQQFVRDVMDDVVMKVSQSARSNSK